MGLIQYTSVTTESCDSCAAQVYDIPVGSTIHEIAEITGACLEDAIKIYESLIEENNELCPTIYYNVQISKSVKKQCTFGNGSGVVVTIPQGMYSSQVSQLDADSKAQARFNATAQSIANDLGFCEETECLSCDPYIVVGTKACGEYRIEQYCDNGVCRRSGQTYFVCLTGNCRGETCVDVSACDDLECPEGYVADCCGGCVADCEGQPCSFKCPHGTCESGTCVDGICIEKGEYTERTCPEGYKLDDNRCIIDCDGAPCSDQCRNGSCTGCGQCKDGRCVDPNCPTGKRLNQSTCQCEDIPCDPACSERLISATECRTVTVAQECRFGNCVDIGSQIAVNQPDGTLCSTGKCLDGVCSGDCVPECVNDPWVNVSGNECQEQRQTFDCINANCVQAALETRNKADGTECSLGTCLSGTCQGDVPGFCDSLQTNIGGAGITDILFEIPYTGVFGIWFDPIAQLDKLEILKETYLNSNEWFIAATTGRTTPNFGPGFDTAKTGINTIGQDIKFVSFVADSTQPGVSTRKLAGDAQGYTSAFVSEDYYVGSAFNGDIPLRRTEFESSTGYSFSNPPYVPATGSTPSTGVQIGAERGDQIVWVTVGGSETNIERVIVRISGTQGTSWNVYPSCFKA